MKKTIVIICIICLSLIFLPVQKSQAGTLDDLRTKIKEKEAEIQQLEARAEEYEQGLYVAQQEKNTLQSQLSIIEGRIGKLQNAINLTSAKIDATSFQIQELNLGIYEKEKEIEKNKQSIAGTIRTIYEYDKRSLLEMVLENERLSDFLNQVQYIKLLQKNLQKNLESLKALKAVLQEKKADLEAKKKDLEEYNAQLYSQKQIEGRQRSQKSYLLQQTRGEERHYQSLLSELEEKQRQIREEIFKIEEELRLTLDPESVPSPRSGVLSWPHEGILTQGYGVTPWSRQLYKSGFHNGIDIATGYGAPIRAASDGEVRAIGNTDNYCLGGSYGRWIAVKHGNNLTTLYAHLSAYGKYSIGDKVSTGDIVGYEGSSGYSSGSHLHFGVYASNTFYLKRVGSCGLVPTGATLNPMDYL